MSPSTNLHPPNSINQTRPSLPIYITPTSLLRSNSMKMAHPIIGSDGWDSDAEGSAKRAISGRKWEQSVLTLCKSLRGGVGCTVGLKYRMGTQNIVKLIEFEDGEKWVIRIPLGDDDAVWAASISQRIENEVATYNYLK